MGVYTSSAIGQGMAQGELNRINASRQKEVDDMNNRLLLSKVNDVEWGRDEYEAELEAYEPITRNKIRNAIPFSADWRERWDEVVGGMSGARTLEDVANDANAQRQFQGLTGESQSKAITDYGLNPYQPGFAQKYIEAQKPTTTQQPVMMPQQPNPQYNPAAVGIPYALDNGMPAVPAEPAQVQPQFTTQTKPGFMPQSLGEERIANTAERNQIAREKEAGIADRFADNLDFKKRTLAINTANKYIGMIGNRKLDAQGAATLGGAAWAELMDQGVIPYGTNEPDWSEIATRLTPNEQQQAFEDALNFGLKQAQFSFKQAEYIANSEDPNYVPEDTVSPASPYGLPKVTVSPVNNAPNPFALPGLPNTTPMKSSSIPRLPTKQTTATARAKAAAKAKEKGHVIADKLKLSAKERSGAAQFAIPAIMQVREPVTVRNFLNNMSNFKDPENGDWSLTDSGKKNLASVKARAKLQGGKTQPEPKAKPKAKGGYTVQGVLNKAKQIGATPAQTKQALIKALGHDFPEARKKARLY
jgi:hypothetical protein